ncbi:hypothetical protein C8R44DRAFT_740472 [Mycena epipterygia]|nr:hypothetical protein C8R44DRAFT_740472 [Mycena epipterygia]
MRLFSNDIILFTYQARGWGRDDGGMANAEIPGHGLPTWPAVRDGHGLRREGGKGLRDVGAAETAASAMGQGQKGAAPARGRDDGTAGSGEYGGSGCVGSRHGIRSRLRGAAARATGLWSREEVEVEVESMLKLMDVGKGRVL